MNNLKVGLLYNGINIEADFNTKLNILAGYSGTGKTLLISAVDFYCLNNDISRILCNYNNIGLSADKIKDICSDTDVVFLDNADLYLTDDILQSILQTAKIIIISMKDTSNISTSDADIYNVEYSNLNLRIRKL